MTGNGPTGFNPGTTPTGSMKSFKEKIPSGYKAGALQQFTPEQMQLFQRLFGQVGPDSYLSKLAGGDEGLFQQIEAPAFRQFNELQGNLASRFSGMGLGGRHTSGFQNASTAAASNFAQDLQSQRQNLQRQAIMDLMGISESLLGQRPHERFITEKEPSFLDKWLGLAGRTMGAAAQSSAGAF